MALSVPLSRFTSRVGGGSAFYVRRLAHIMKSPFLFLLCVCLLAPSCSTHRVSTDADTELYRQAFSPCFGGVTQKALAYQGRSLLCAFRCPTSGVTTSEPFVFVQRANGWHCLYHAPLLRFGMDATIDGGRLILWRLDWPNGKLQRTEYWSYDLNHLDAA